MRLSACFIVALQLVLAVSSSEARADWLVTRVSDPSNFIVSGPVWRRLVAGMVLPETAWISTGRRGRVLLSRDGVVVQFKPNTVAAISERLNNGRRETSLLHKFGEVFVDVDVHASAGRNLEIATPYVSATVKGTRFRVGVGSDRTRLRVREGEVQVTDLVRGERIDVRAGQRVTVTAAGNRRLNVIGPGPKAPVIKVTPPEPRVRPARRAPVRGRKDDRRERQTDDLPYNERMHLEAPRTPEPERREPPSRPRERPSPSTEPIPG